MSRKFLLLKDCDTGGDCPACVKQLRDSVASTFQDMENASYQLGPDNFPPGTDLSNVINNNTIIEKIHNGEATDHQMLFIPGTTMSGESSPATTWPTAQNYVTIPTPTARPDYIYRKFPGDAHIFLADPLDWKTKPDQMDYLAATPVTVGYTRHGHIYAHWVNTDRGTEGYQVLGAFDDGYLKVHLPDWTLHVFIGEDTIWGLTGGKSTYGNYLSPAGKTAPNLYVVTLANYDYRPPWIRER